MIPLWVKNRGEQITDSATFRWLAQDAGSGAVDLTLLKGSGSATFTRAGATATTVLSTGLVSSAISANTARSYYDPAPTGGTGSYMYLPGVSGAYASTPDSSAVSVTGDIDLRAQILGPYTTGGSRAIIAKDNTVANRSYRLAVSSGGGGTLVLAISFDGTTSNVNATSTAAIPYADNTLIWVRATWASSTGTVKFYTSLDGSSWTQLGTDVSASSGTIYDSTVVVELGSAGVGTSALFAGRIYRAQIYNGIGGTLVADFDPTRTTQASTSFSGSTGETWTINGRGFIYAAPAYLGYLAEESRVNLVLRSEDFSLAWAAVGTPTRSAAAKTCGSVNLDLIGDDSAAALEGYTQTITYTGNATKVVSLFIAQGTSTSVMVRLRDTTAPADRLLAAITWAATGLPIITMTTGTSLGYQIFPNGIFRVSLLSSSVTAANTNSLEFYPATDAALSVANTGNVYIGGVESNNAEFSTSYIPTAAATSTRAADVLTFPSAGNVIDASGTVFARASSVWATASATSYVLATDSSGRFIYNSGGAATGFNNFDGTTVGGATGTSYQNRVAKLATSWGGATKTSYFDAVPGGSWAYDGTFVTGAIAIGVQNGGGGPWNGTIRDVRIWQRVLSDSEVQAL